MGMGRIGNFIDGQIVGAVTDLPWAVKFPYALFREYPVHRLALGTGQTLNIIMAVVGAGALYRSRLRR